MASAWNGVGHEEDLAALGDVGVERGQLRREEIGLRARHDHDGGVVGHLRVPRARISSLTS